MSKNIRDRIKKPLQSITFAPNKTDRQEAGNRLNSKNMRTHNFELNGLTYTIEQSISGGYCRLLYGQTILLDDPACADFYGKPEELEDVFKTYIQEEASRRFPWWVLRGAIVEQGSDPATIETEEDARQWADTINGGRVWEITDASDLETSRRQLGFEDGERVAHIFAFVNGNRGNFALYDDF